MQSGRGTRDSHQTTYRPDLDGLRAVAVMSVIAFHLWYPAWPGGYLGVDIFFVLSGYLITNIIWREALSGEFSIARFYERRVRRIMPALVVLLVAVSVFATALLLPVDLKDYAKSVFATLAFAANIYFWRDTNYFGGAAQEKPLLHVWSLGVEEQFYLIFPLLMVLCIRRRRSVLSRVICALVLLSLASNFLVARMDATAAAFFLLPTRAWEIGAGALLALAPPVRIAYHPWLRHTLACLAAALFIGGLCFVRTLPGGLVPPPFWVVVATTLTMHLGTAGGSWLTFCLSRAPLVWIGQISYSLYLWHWPILVFALYYLARPVYLDHPALPPVASGFAVVLTFAAAQLSWRYVERPFRNRSMPIRAVLAWMALASSGVAISSAAILAYHGFPSRFSADVTRIGSAVDTQYRCNLSESIALGSSRGCLMALPGRDPSAATVALVGNSHAQMYAPLITEILRENNRGGILIPMNGCLPMVDFNESKTCMAIAARNLTAVEGLPHIRLVIISMTWEFPDPMFTPAGLVPKQSESKVLMESLDRLIQELKQRGKIVVLIGPISEPRRDSASIVARQLAFQHRVSEPLFAPESAFTAKEGDTIAHYASRADIVFIRPDLVQCKLDRCDYFRDGSALFADSNHIAEAELPLFRPAFEQALQPLLIQHAQSPP